MILDYLSCCYLWEFYRAGFTIALAIRSFDPIRSLDLSTRLIPSGALVRANSAPAAPLALSKAGARCTPYNC